MRGFSAEVEDSGTIRSSLGKPEDRMREAVRLSEKKAGLAGTEARSVVPVKGTSETLRPRHPGTGNHSGGYVEVWCHCICH